MPVYSMTGYASVQHSPLAADGETPANSAPTARLGLEIRSVNSRFLDLSFRLPEELRQLEPGLRELITRQIKRGKVEVRASRTRAMAPRCKPPTTKPCKKSRPCKTKFKIGCPMHGH